MKKPQSRTKRDDVKSIDIVSKEKTISEEQVDVAIKLINYASEFGCRIDKIIFS